MNRLTCVVLVDEANISVVLAIIALLLAFLSGSYIYVQLFHFNCIEKDLYIAIRVKLLNINIEPDKNTNFRRTFQTTLRERTLSLSLSLSLSICLSLSVYLCILGL